MSPCLFNIFINDCVKGKMLAGNTVAWRVQGNLRMINIIVSEKDAKSECWEEKVMVFEKRFTSDYLQDACASRRV